MESDDRMEDDEWKRMLVIAPVVMRRVVGNNRMYLGKRG
jgi:hypothetical protein